MILSGSPCEESLTKRAALQLPYALRQLDYQFEIMDLAGWNLPSDAYLLVN